MGKGGVGQLTAQTLTVAHKDPRGTGVSGCLPQTTLRTAYFALRINSPHISSSRLAQESNPSGRVESAAGVNAPEQRLRQLCHQAGIKSFSFLIPAGLRDRAVVPGE